MSAALYVSLLALIVLKSVSLSPISLGFIFPLVLFSITRELLFHKRPLQSFFKLQLMSLKRSCACDIAGLNNCSLPNSKSKYLLPMENSSESTEKLLQDFFDLF